jgi:phosphohistidine phosphatase SixA
MRKPPRKASTARRPPLPASSSQENTVSTTEPPSRDKLCDAKTLIVVRHATYDPDTGYIDSDGEKRLVILARNLEPYLSGKTVRIVSSMAPRAFGSAAELARQIRISCFECHTALWDDDNHVGDNEIALALIEKEFASCDVLIVVAHLINAKWLPVKYARQRGVKVEALEIQKGAARVIVFGGEELVDTVVVHE